MMSLTVRSRGDFMLTNGAINRDFSQMTLVSVRTACAGVLRTAFWRQLRAEACTFYYASLSTPVPASWKWSGAQLTSRASNRMDVHTAFSLNRAAPACIELFAYKFAFRNEKSLQQLQNCLIFASTAFLGQLPSTFEYTCKQSRSTFRPLLRPQ
jgi:hypothetical protein